MSSQNAPVGKGKLPFNNLVNNRYLIQRILGKGSLGKTYLALDTHRFNEPCVLKEFAPQQSNSQYLQKSRALFQREAQILNRIDCPQIPEFLACFEVEGRLWVVQEYVRGQTYSALLAARRQGFSESEIVFFLKSLLPVLGYIHSLGIVHRDICPNNIVQPEGEKLPVPIDFGLGKLANLATSAGSNSSSQRDYVSKISFVGKVGYAPREQIILGKCFPASDLYALGVTALVLLTAKEPTALINSCSLEWQWRKYVDISPDLALILTRMTADKPLQRYQSAKEVMEQLKALSNPAPPPKPAFSEKTAILSNSIPDDTVIFANPSSQPQTKLIQSRKAQPTTDETMILSGAPLPKPASSPTVDRTMLINTEDNSQKDFSKNSIRRLEQTLALYLGTVASSMVVQEVRSSPEVNSTEELIRGVARYIPDSKKAQDFIEGCSDL